MWISLNSFPLYQSLFSFWSLEHLKHEIQACIWLQFQSTSAFWEIYRLGMCQVPYCPCGNMAWHLQRKLKSSKQYCFAWYLQSEHGNWIAWCSLAFSFGYASHDCLGQQSWFTLPWAKAKEMEETNVCLTISLHMFHNSIHLKCLSCANTMVDFHLFPMVLIGFNLLWQMKWVPQHWKMKWSATSWETKDAWFLNGTL